MKRVQRVFQTVCLILTALGALLIAQPRLIVPEAGSYLPGEKLDDGIFVYDSGGRRIALRELMGSGNKAIVLSLMGGASEKPVSTDHRGNLWCEDSFDDLAVQRALVSRFRDQPVKFIAVAIPAVLSVPEGQEGNLYLEESEEGRDFLKIFGNFRQKTEAERISTVLPFDEIFYDPRGRLILGRDALGEIAPGYGEVHDWQGKLKWHLDPRTYGLPTIWILSGDGVVVSEPFWGNDYDSVPPQVNYGFEELKAAVEKLLEQPQAAE